MTKPTRIEIDCSTGEVHEIELTDAQVAELAYQAELAAERKAEEERVKAELAATKAAVLERLGITEDEAKALLS